MNAPALKTLVVACLLATGCQGARRSALVGLPCGDEETCIEGFACHPLTLRCVKAVEVDCDSENAPCPKSTEEGDPCQDPGSFLPCGDTVTDCSLGCRTCGESGQWGPCAGGACNSDRDKDGLADCFDGCVDGDGDGLGDGTLENVDCEAGDAVDVNDDSRFACGDVDGDSCDDCAGGSWNPAADGLDTDGDGICDISDGCSDADGDGVGGAAMPRSGCLVADGDSDDSDANACADTDGDGCDDCVSGVFDPANDGDDSDVDGLCDAGDTCTDLDGDGLGSESFLDRSGCYDAEADIDDDDFSRCVDTDGDGCDDCAYGTFDPANDGSDLDGDGSCDPGDDCTDGDGDGLGSAFLDRSGCVNEAADSDDNNPNACADTDADGCDDCALGPFNPDSDGADGDNDGVCDAGDFCTDGDGDGLGVISLDRGGCLDETADSDDSDRTVCADTDLDACDDCTSRVFDPAHDGPDGDGDGWCDISDVCTDNDGDGVGAAGLNRSGCGFPQHVDSDDNNGVICADTDADGCDDCTSGVFDPANDAIDDDGDGSCNSADDCTDADGDGLGRVGFPSTACTDPTPDDDDGNPNACADTDADNCDDCALGPFDPANDGIDLDGDDLCDAGDTCTDVDGDGLGIASLDRAGCANGAADSDDGNPNVCADTDVDGCDDCAYGPFDPAHDGSDLDGDGLCDAGDTCTDADGDGLGEASLDRAGCVSTTADSNDNNPDVCADTDVDTCDDCAQGPFDPAADGSDLDGDGLCDAGDTCTDVDGDGFGVVAFDRSGCLRETQDVDDANPNACADTDGDGCDDCSKGSFDPSQDGDDVDGDSICDTHDPCIDSDGDGLGVDGSDTSGCADATVDTNDTNPNACADTDGDQCDDCVSGTFDPPNDGADTDGDGLCDVGDGCTDFDGDGIGLFSAPLRTGCLHDADDSDDNNPNACADTDWDGCDDCTSGVFAPAEDGIDEDSDGICNVNDCDDGKPYCTTVCDDLDGDDWCIDFDCDDTLPVCGSDCTTNSDRDLEAPAVVDCVESYCGSDPADPASSCTLVATQDELRAALVAGGNVLIETSIILDKSAPVIIASYTEVRQRAGVRISVNSGDKRAAFKTDAATSNVTLDGLNIRNTSNMDSGVEFGGPDHTIQNLVVDGAIKRGIYLKDAARALVRDNLTMNQAEGDPSDDEGGIVVKDSTDCRVVGNVIMGNESDGIQIRGSSGTFIDHNTVTGNGFGTIKLRDGIRIVYGKGDVSLDTCIRNNIIHNNAGYAFVDEEDKGSTWNSTAACVGPLSGGGYGNDDFGNGLGTCNNKNGDTGYCSDCSCLPTSQIMFFNLGVDPAFQSLTVGESGFACPTEATLVDAVMDLGYDRNGEADGTYAGSGPDVGARESGVGDCP